MDVSSTNTMYASYSNNPTVTIISLIITILVIVAQWKMFEKAGKPGWASIVPIYNGIVLLNIVGMSGWYVILYCIPIVNLVIDAIVSVKTAKAFGKGTGFGIGVFLLPYIFQPILGFGDAKYVGVPQE